MNKTLITKRDVVTACLCGFVLLVCAGAVGQHSREQMFRALCMQNLRGLGQAMLLYANDYQNELPKAGARENDWVHAIPDWRAATREKAFDIDMQKREKIGKTTVTSSLYLLVKYSEVDPRTFVCKSDKNVRAFKPSEVPETLTPGWDYRAGWDFGGWYDPNNNPSRHCSYAYHIPFGSHVLRTSSDPNMAVLADRNPWMNPDRVSDPCTGWSLFRPDATDSNDPKALLGNSDTHQRDGQTVLYLDSHAKFETRAACGVEQDNIYTLQSDSSLPGRNRGTLPTIYQYRDNQIRSTRDSVLVQEYGLPQQGPSPR